MTDRAPYDAETLAVLRFKAKVALRNRMKAVRAALPAEAIRRRSEAICARVMALDAWRSARCVSLFIATEHEVHLDVLLDDARSRGITVAIPAVREGERAMRFGAHLLDGRTIPLQRSDFGVMEPDPTAPPVDPADLDLIVVPALVLDPTGHRLGYGRAHYDNTLPLCPRALRVAVAFDFQLIAEVPAEPHDVPAQVVITDARTIEVSAAPSTEAS